MMYPCGTQPLSFILPLSELCQPASDHYAPLKMVNALYVKTVVQLQHTNVKITHIKILCRNYTHTHTHTQINPLIQEFATMTAKRKVIKHTKYTKRAKYTELLQSKTL
jgi:hypothetical protein